MMHDFQQASGSLEGERRQKRIITDARREQNRAASRAYRQRQKQTSQPRQQNARGGSRRYHELKPRHHYDTVESTSILSKRAGVPSMSAQLQDNRCINPCLDSIAFQPVSLKTTWGSGGTIQPISPQGRDVNQDECLSFSEAMVAFDPVFDDRQVGKYPAFEPTASSLAIADLDTHGSATSGIRTPFMSSLMAPSENHMVLVASHFFGPEAILAYPMPRDAALECETVENSMSLLLQLNPKEVSTFHLPSSEFPSKYQISDQEYDSQGLSMNEFRNEGLRLEPFSYIKSSIVFEDPVQSQTNSMYLAMPSLLPDFDKPYIRRSKLSPSIAYMHVAILLGITLHDLASGKHSSPFYRQTTAEDDPKALLAAAAIPSLPAHLQPTLPQILFPHNPNLDLLPFPLLRARAITLAATTPRLVNPKELKTDILRDGLICWHGRNDDEHGIGQPWDIHSWEVASWFKKKWRMLFDEEDFHHF